MSVGFFGRFFDALSGDEGIDIPSAALEIGAVLLGGVDEEAEAEAAEAADSANAAAASVFS